MQHISALNLSSFRWKFLHRNSERYVWNRALDVPNCRRSFRFTRIHGIFSIFCAWSWTFSHLLYALINLIKIRSHICSPELICRGVRDSIHTTKYQFRGASERSDFNQTDAFISQLFTVTCKAKKGHGKIFYLKWHWYMT